MGCSNRWRFQRQLFVVCLLSRRTGEPQIEDYSGERVIRVKCALPSEEMTLIYPPDANLRRKRFDCLVRVPNHKLANQMEAVHVTKNETERVARAKNHLKILILLAHRGGFEPPTP